MQLTKKQGLFTVYLLGTPHRQMAYIEVEDPPSFKDRRILYHGN